MTNSTLYRNQIDSRKIRQCRKQQDSNNYFNAKSWLRSDTELKPNEMTIYISEKHLCTNTYSYIEELFRNIMDKFPSIWYFHFLKSSALSYFRIVCNTNGLWKVKITHLKKKIKTKSFQKIIKILRYNMPIPYTVYL